MSDSGFRAVLRSGDLFLGVRPSGSSGWSLPGGVARGVRPAEAVAHAVFHLSGLKAVDVIPAGRVELTPPESFSSEDGDVVVDHAFAYTSSWGGDLGPPDGREAAWVSASELLSGPDGLTARDVLNRLGLIRRPRLSLEDLYLRSSRAMEDPGSESRMARLTEAVDIVMDEFYFLFETRKSSEVDRILEEADVPRLHADILDTMLAATESYSRDLPHRESFAADAAAVIDAVNARIPKRRLVADSGEVLSEDVRADARRKYAAQAAEFGRELRETGSLDRHYASKRSSSKL